MTETILIVDFGSQVTQLIARRIREAGVYSEIYPYHRVDSALLASLQPKGIVLSGGPASATAESAPAVDESVLAHGVPVLGICYGQQTLCAQLGGRLDRPRQREYGRAELEVTAACRLFEGVWPEGSRHQVWMSHGDAVVAPPPGFSAVAASEGAPLAALADDARGFYGVQFHPEVVHTPDGSRLLANFVRHVCGCRGDWTMAAFRDQAIERIRAQVGDRGVICGLSGGVDSAVTAVLLHEAIGDQLTCIFVDTGLLRAGEADQVVGLFRDSYNIPLIHRDASETFLGLLHDVEDPEAKRRIVGNSFVEIFEAEAQRIGDAAFLAQGTLYPDVIESVSATGGPSVTIKSHHNVGGLPERMNLALVEPLRDLFKDEVRALGQTLRLPDAFVKRQPFPGPGLAIRVPGAIDRDKLAVLRQADTIFHEEIARAGLYDSIWQAFAVLLPVRTVGVMGDERTYDRVCALRAVTSSDGMTADYYPFDHSFLGRTATRIVNEVRGINRVVYDVTSKPPGTVEWE